MFDPIGEFKVCIYVGDKTIVKQLDFYTDTMSNKQICVECFLQDHHGVWDDDTFYPFRLIDRVVIGDNL